LPDSVKTVGDWIRVKRIGKNLSAHHLAVKMGIATALIRSWESETGRPDNRQLKTLANILECDPVLDPLK